MNDIFSKLIKNFKKIELKKNEPILKFPTEIDNRTIENQRAIQIDHSLEIQKQDRLKKQENERKKLANEKEKQDELKKQQNEIYLRYTSEFEKIYKRSDVTESVNDS